jgi:hypothetical protein
MAAQFNFSSDIEKVSTIQKEVMHDVVGEMKKEWWWWLFDMMKKRAMSGD